MSEKPMREGPDGESVFHRLKMQQMAGMSVKERTRLFVVASLALVLGSVIYVQHGCARWRDEPPPPPGRVQPAESARPRRAMDLAPFEEARRQGGAAPDLLRGPLDHALREVRSDQVDLEPAAARSSPAAVAALDPATAVGTAVDVVGRVRQLDSEPYEGTVGSVDVLWSFALEGEDGARVIVLHGGSSSAPERGKPLDATLVHGYPVHHVAEDDVVLVRGVYLQRKTAGVVGQIRLGGPTPVVVGARYRRLPRATPLPPPSSLDEIDWASVRDREIRDGRNLQIPQHFQVFAWARAKGHDAIAAELKSGALPSQPYDRDAYRRWSEELARDDRELSADAAAADRRDWTRAARGKVWMHTGQLHTYDAEGWDTIGPNDMGVDERWTSWLVSDHHHSFGVLRFDSPFPLSAFAGVQGRRGERVRAYGVFVKNYSYLPSAKEQEATAPYFVLLHMEPYTSTRPSGLWNNVFWYATLALLVLGVLFYFVLVRGEAKESKVMEERRIALRKRIRAIEGLPGDPAARSSQALPRDPGPGAGPPA